MSRVEGDPGLLHLQGSKLKRYQMLKVLIVSMAQELKGFKG